MHSRIALLGLLAPLAAAAAETMTVTAYRTPQALDRAGSAVSLISRDQIEERQAVLAADALRALPGVSVARSGPVGAQTQVRVRGAEANQLLVLIDGVEANDLATDDAFSFEHLTTADVERIEVVRGPQSALWGSDALAGVINVVTRRPTRLLETSGYVEGGSFGLANGGARIGVRDGAIAASASLSHFRTDGVNASRVGFEEDAYDNTTFNLAGTMTVSPNLTLDASVRHTDATAEFDALDYVDGVLLPVDADNQTDLGHTYARGGGRLDLADGRWSHELHYGITATDTDTAAENLFSGDVDRASTEGDKYGLYYQSAIRVTAADAAGPGDLLTLALDHEREEFSQRAAPSFFGDPNQDQGLHTTGFAAEYIAFLGSGLTLSASARHDDNSDFGDVNTWRTTASWRLRESGPRLHGSVGTGQKSPTFFERYGYTPDTFVGNPDLEPETSTGWDAGVEQRWLDGRLVTDLTYFRADLDDEINGFFCPPPTFACTAVNEPGESRRRGLELSAEAELSPAWSLTGSYTYTDAEESETQPDGSDARVREIRRPMHAAALNATARLLNGRLVVNGGVAYTGDREDDAFLLDPPFAARVDLDEYTLVNLAISYELSRRVTVYGRVENALSEDYEDVYGFNTPGAGAFAGLRVSLDR
jgi:vitamin B12 transporter